MRALPTLRRLCKGTLLVLISAFATFSQIPSKVDDSATVKGRVTSNGRGVAGCAVMMWNPLFNEPPAQGTHTAKTARDDNFRMTVPPVEINSGTNLTGVRLVLVLATASLRGTTKFLNGDKLGAIRGTAGLYNGQTLVGAAVIDDRGSFLLESIPAGSYRLIVSVAIPGPKPETLRSEQAIDLNDHQALEIVVWLDPSSNSP